jgi:hypothetical protein
LVFDPLSIIDKSIREQHLTAALHNTCYKVTFVDHLFIFKFHSSSANDRILSKFTLVDPQARLESVDTEALLNSVLEVAFIDVAILVLDFSFAVDLALLEGALVLRAVLEKDRALPVFGIVEPFADVHITIWIFSEAVSAELAIDEFALITDASVFDEHAQPIVLPVAPFALIVLALILPNIDSVAIKVVMYELALVPVTSLLEDKHTESMHHLSLQDWLEMLLFAPTW